MRGLTAAPMLIHLRRFSLLQRPDLQKTNWKQDVVYLFQFKRSPVVPNISPFCLKTETFIRAHELKHEVIGSWTLRSKEDSQIILWHLIKHFKIDERLSPEQQGISRAVDRLIEGSLFYPITYLRSVENAKNCVNRNVSGLPLPGFLVQYVANKLSKAAKSKLRAEGTALDQILGDKKFLIGARPTTPDFTLFGHLASVYYLPFRTPLADLLENEYPRVRLLLERMRIHYWSDWKKS
uniref:Uncharacterized protein n=1 Tax=Ditylenchus dipsaci TaxID=166011 RepID=A0A915DJV9_9BILA